MADVDGQWDCTAQTPMGPQNWVLTVKSDGDSFTGSNSGDLGTMDIDDGRVDGNTLHWSMDITKPMAMKLHASATVEGDTLAGEIKLGAFGTAPIKGTRKG